MAPSVLKCPVCGDTETRMLIERKGLITMQNYVYRDHASALAAPTGDLELRLCSHCGFAYNGLFDPQLMSYDQNYDNQVPSPLFLDYYKQVAHLLHEKFDLEGQLVVEIGCGKGTFLRTLCTMYPSVRGLGIDPSYVAPESDELPDNLEFVADIFKQEYLPRQPALVISRHVLEHIFDPASFLRSVREPLQEFPDTPVFIEVPDLEWMILNNAFHADKS
jgi:SAM-dependent methyltransferase